MKYFKEVKDGIGTKLVKVTREQIADAKHFKHILDSAKKDVEKAVKSVKTFESMCKHIVLYDISGDMYDTRHCLACGKHMGMI